MMKYSFLLITSIIIFNGVLRAQEIDKAGIFIEEYINLNFQNLWIESELTNPFYGAEYLSMDLLNEYQEGFLKAYDQNRFGPIGVRLSISDSDARFSLGMDVNYSQTSKIYDHRSIIGGSWNAGNDNFIYGDGVQTTNVKQGKVQALVFGSIDFIEERRAFSLSAGFGVGMITWTNQWLKSDSEQLNGFVNKVTDERNSPSAFLYLKARWMVHPRFGFVLTLGIGNSIFSTGVTQKISDTTFDFY